MKNEIINWLKELPYWQQVLGRFVLQNGRIDEKEIDEVYEIFKSENSLSSKPLRKKLINLAYEQNAISTDKWQAVTNFQGVNAIYNQSKLLIERKGLTLLHGNNGSGKSGIVRVLNNAFVSRGETNVLPNIYDEEKTDTKNMFSADFTFKNKEGEKIKLTYPRDKNNALFRNISVFDTKSAIRDLAHENELSFIPTELKFFQFFSEALVLVNQKFKEEKN